MAAPRHGATGHGAPGHGHPSAGERSAGERWEDPRYVARLLARRPPPSPEDLADPVEQVAWLVAASGAAVADALGSVDLPAVDDAGVLEAVAAAQRAIAWATARQVEALAEWAGRHQVHEDGAPWPSEADASAITGPGSAGERLPGRGVAAEFAAEEVAARCRWAPRTASARLEEATWLARCLPHTLAALRTGRVDAPRARVVAAGTAVLEPQRARQVDEVLHTGHGPRRHRDPESLTPGQLRPVLARIVDAVDAGASGRRAEVVRGLRGVTCAPLPDAAAAITATGPAADVLTVMTALDRAADTDRSPGPRGERRGVDARRFDALVGWARAFLEGAEAGAPDDGAGLGVHRRGARAHICVTVAASTLLGLDEQPGALAGYGPLPAPVVREIARGGTWRRLLVDSATGALVGVDGHVHPPGWTAGADGGGRDGGPGAPTAAAAAAAPSAPPVGPERIAGTRCPVAAAGGGPYRPSAPLARLVRLRDRTCTLPGCRLPAHLCDLDHAISHPEGPTCACNLHPLCRRHHRLKHEAGWRLQLEPDGTATWVTPAGVVIRCTRDAVLPRVAVSAVAGFGSGEGRVPEQRLAPLPAALPAAPPAAPSSDPPPAARQHADPRRAASPAPTLPRGWPDGPPPF